MVLRVDISEWIQYEDSIQSVLDSMPEITDRVMNQLVLGFLTALITIVDQQNITYTGTFRDSLRVIEEKNGRVLTQIPTGQGAERLPIYWKVLERGTPPLKPVPLQPIVEWAEVKLGDAQLGRIITRSLRERGIQPHPVFSRLFVLDSDFNAVGLTVEGEEIALRVIEEYHRGIEEHLIRRGLRAGQLQRIRRGERGRFISF